MRRDNTSGVTGVFHTTVRRKATAVKKAVTTECWVAQSPDQRTSRFFSIRRYGGAKAKRMAVAARREMES